MNGQYSAKYSSFRTYFLYSNVLYWLHQTVSYQSDTQSTQGSVIKQRN
jgi:hypothetical protein